MENVSDNTESKEFCLILRRIAQKEDDYA